MFAGRLRKELKQQYERHYRRLRDTIGVNVFMNLMGYGLLVGLVSGAGLNKSLGNPAVGVIMFPVGWALNRFIVFRDQYDSKSLGAVRMSHAIRLPIRAWDLCRQRYKKTFDDEFDDSEKWLVKTLSFTALGQGSYQLMVTLAGWNYADVRLGLMFTLGPLSLWANYWVFRRQVKKNVAMHQAHSAIETT